MTTVEDTTKDVERLEAFHDLLPALARTLDVRDIFQHLSDVAARDTVAILMDMVRSCRTRAGRVSLSRPARGVTRAATPCDIAGRNCR